MMLSNTMEKDWLPIIGTLAGVLAGGSITLFSKWIEIKAQANKEKRTTILKKIEDIHELLSDYVIISHTFYFNITEYKKSDSNKHQSEILKTEAMNVLAPINPIHTKLMIYAPELATEWDAAVVAIGNYQEVGFQYLMEEISQEEFLEKTTLIEKPVKIILEKLEMKAASILK